MPKIMPNPMKILIVKTSSLGDVIHCLPVINDIIRVYPSAQIDWIVEESFADIPRLHPAINQVYTVAFRRWRSKSKLSSTAKALTAPSIRSALASVVDEAAFIARLSRNLND